jgi:dolichyl-phosphate-mannose-protein mannosyltransferase
MLYGKSQIRGYIILHNNLMQTSKFSCLLFPALLVFIWLAMTVLVNPIGDFPLNDDWCYGKTVHSLIVDKDLEFPKWGAPTLIAQVLWGALFCLPYGFSFTALRFSTLVLSLTGILLTYQIFKQLFASPKTAFIAALLICVNPLYFLLSNSFMTDVPFYAVSMIAVLAYIRAIKNDSVKWVIIATIAACIAILIRQVGLVIPVAFALTIIYKDGLKYKTILKAFLPVLAAIAVYVLYLKLMQATIGLPGVHDYKFKELIAIITHPTIGNVIHTLKRSVGCMIYLGLFCLPFLFVNTIKRFKAAGKKQRIIFFASIFVISCLLTVFLILKKTLMPIYGNIIYDFGLGPALLYDTYVLELPNLTKASPIFWIIVTAVSVLSGAVLIDSLIFSAINLVKSDKTPDRTEVKYPAVFAIITGILYFAPLAITSYFDRYLIFLIPLVMIFIFAGTNTVSATGKTSFVVGFIVAILFACFTLAGTHDYLAWNRARWQALNRLTTEQDISPHMIDGGFEFNGWNRDPSYPEKFIRKWWVYRDDYVIAFGDIEGYKKTSEYPYQKWLPFGNDKIVVLQKQRF